jgi:hypothetical protein
MLDSGFNNLSHEALDHLDIQATWDVVNNDPEVFDAANETGYGDHGPGHWVPLPAFIRRN